MKAHTRPMPACPSPRRPVGTGGVEGGRVGAAANGESRGVEEGSGAGR